MTDCTIGVIDQTEVPVADFLLIRTRGGQWRAGFQDVASKTGRACDIDANVCRHLSYRPSIR